MFTYVDIFLWRLNLDHMVMLKAFENAGKDRTIPTLNYFRRSIGSSEALTKKLAALHAEKEKEAKLRLKQQDEHNPERQEEMVKRKKRKVTKTFDFDAFVYLRHNKWAPSFKLYAGRDALFEAIPKINEEDKEKMNGILKLQSKSKSEDAEKKDRPLKRTRRSKKAIGHTAETTRDKKPRTGRRN